MSSIIINCRGEKNGRQEKIDGFRKKLGVTEFDVMVLSEYPITHWVLNQIKNRKNVSKRKPISIVLCQNLWNWSLFL